MHNNLQKSYYLIPNTFLMLELPNKNKYMADIFTFALDILFFLFTLKTESLAEISPHAAIGLLFLKVSEISLIMAHACRW
jgi:hypothetical protein